MSTLLQNQPDFLLSVQRQRFHKGLRVKYRVRLENIAITDVQFYLNEYQQINTNHYTDVQKITLSHPAKAYLQHTQRLPLTV